MSEKDSTPQGGRALKQALKQAAHGDDQGPSLPEFKEDLENTLRHMAWCLGGPV